MSFLKPIFENKNRKMLLDLIEHNADIIEKDESRTRVDAEYLAICLILDDLAGRPNEKRDTKLLWIYLQKSILSAITM